MVTSFYYKILVKYLVHLAAYVNEADLCINNMKRNHRCWHLVFYHLVVMRCQPLLLETLLLYEAGLSSSMGGCWISHVPGALDKKIFELFHSKKMCLELRNLKNKE